MFFPCNYYMESLLHNLFFPAGEQWTVIFFVIIFSHNFSYEHTNRINFSPVWGIKKNCRIVSYFGTLNSVQDCCTFVLFAEMGCWALILAQGVVPCAIRCVRSEEQGNLSGDQPYFTFFSIVFIFFTKHILDIYH